MKRIIIKLIAAIILAFIEMMVGLYVTIGVGLSFGSLRPRWLEVIFLIIAWPGILFLNLSNPHQPPYFGTATFPLIILFLFFINYLVLSLFEHFYWNRRSG